MLSLHSNDDEFIHQGEILLRMTDKKGDLISPVLFLPAAERYNMITIIDEWVTEKTFQWQTSLNQRVLTSINVSGKSISDKEFMNFIVTKIKQSKINPGLLCFEINEVSAINHLTNAIHFMTTLKKLGCTFSLDNFGSGHSSFSYLEKLPVDYLKIDGNFIMDIDKDPIHYAMVRSIHDTAQAMGIKTIAEYATSNKVIECLRDIGIDYAQGYAISKPVPLSSYNAEENDDRFIFKKF
jgi:EAL domain-containing protein (putative c-di-GMP-specific phosphodiesterase class I)